MVLSLFLTDTFNRGTTSPDAAGTTTGVGNGWIDRVGGVWHLASGAIAPFTDNTSSYATNWLVRPVSEASLSQRAAITFLPAARVPIVLLRVDSANDNAYAAFCDSSLHVASFKGGTNTSLGVAGIPGFSDATTYIIDFTAAPNASAGTDLTATVYDAAAPTVALVTVAVTGDATSGLQAAASYGIAGANSFNGASKAVLYSGASGGSSGGGTGGSQTMVASPSSFPLGAATAFTLTGTGTSWTGATRPSVTGGSNAFASEIQVSGQVITGFLNPGTVAGTLTLGDTLDAATTPVTAAANVINNIAWHGDSLTAGQGGTGQGTASATRLATVLTALGPTWQGANFGNPGHTLVQMLSEVATAVSPAFNPGKAANVLVVQGGHNDLYQGADAATVINRIRSYLAAVLAAHPWQVIWSTAPPGGQPTYSPGFNGARSTVNAWMRANWQALGISALSDFALDSRMGVPGCEYNGAYYNGDHIHPTDAGYAVWGSYDAAAVAALVGVGVKRWTHL